MANLNAILKNKMGLSAEQAKKSKVLASLSGSYRQNMKSIHYTRRIEICHITDIYEKQKDYSVLKNEEKYMIEKVYDDNMLSFKEKGLYTAIYLNETMNVDQLVESGKDKADAVRSGLKKLIEKQYIKKSVVREKNGNFVTVYYQVIE